MRVYLHTIFALMALTLFAACENNEPQKEEPTPEPEVKSLFEFSGEIASQVAISVNIKSNDPEMEYVALIAQKKYFTLNGIDTAKKLLDDDFAFISDYANRYNMSHREYLESMGWLIKGDKVDYNAKGLYPDTEYVVYCYGVEFTDEGMRGTTDVYHTVIKTSGPITNDANFTIDCSVDGNIVDISIDTNGYEGYYYYYLIPETSREYLPEGEAMDSTHVEMLSNMTYDNFNQWINIDGIAIDKFCVKGATNISERVEPNTNYMAVAFALSEDTIPLLCSTPSVKYFTSGDFSKSELTLDVQVTGITSYEAILNVKPSNENDAYTCIFLSASQVPLYDSNYQLMKFIAENFEPSIFNGPIENEKLGPLMPDTEYVVYAFGIDGEMPTTELYEIRFTSNGATEGSVEITDIKILQLFDKNEIIAIDPSYRAKLGDCECIAIVEATTNTPCDTLYFWWYEEWMTIEYSEEAFLEDLLMYPYANNPEIMDMYYSMNNDDKFLFAGIAEDESGNLSDIFYSDSFLLSKDMVSPAEEFFKYVEDDNAATTMVLFRRQRP